MEYFKIYQKITQIQDSLIFKPNQTSKDYCYLFKYPYEEMYISVDEGVRVHGVLLHTEQKCKGLVFYLHGNQACVQSWDAPIEIYLNQGYDLFIWDYRGYGKSDGKIISETQFFQDAQLVYNKIKQRYLESQILLIGYSLGTVLATKLAAENKPQKLILKAPYYSLLYVARQRYFSFIPHFLFKYPLESYKYIDKVVAPITIFHGIDDKIIYYDSSLKLKAFLKENDRIVLLKNQSHLQINKNNIYQEELIKLLKD